MMKKALVILLCFITIPALAKYEMTEKQYNDFAVNCETNYKKMIDEYEDNETNRGAYKNAAKCVCDKIRNKFSYRSSEFRTIKITDREFIYDYLNEIALTDFCVDIYEMDIKLGSY